MVILITGASHSGKTFYAQKLLEKYHYPYLSIDHLKMGLIRSGQTDLSPLSDDLILTEYLWPIVCEIIKTAIENNQNLIVEGCYVPFDWAKYFEQEYLDNISFRCIVMSEKFITNHFNDILKYSDVIEKRLTDDITIEKLINDNFYYSTFAKKYGNNVIQIDREFDLPT